MSKINNRFCFFVPNNRQNSTFCDIIVLYWGYNVFERKGSMFGDKKSLSETEIRTRYISPSLVSAGWSYDNIHGVTKLPKSIRRYEI